MPVPLSEAAMVCVDFDIATWDFIMDEEDPTSSEGMVSSSGVVVWARGCCRGRHQQHGHERRSRSMYPLRQLFIPPMLSSGFPTPTWPS